MDLVAPWHVGTCCTRDRTHVLCIGRRILNHWTTREAPIRCFRLPFHGNDVLFSAFLESFCILRTLFFLFFNLNIGASGKHVPPAPQHRSQTHEPSCSSSQRSSRCPSFEYFSKSLQQFPAAVNNGNYNYRASPLRSSKHFLDAAALILVTRV